ncbi:amino acid ABC transporter permease [Nocardioides marmorisolisilvae]|uniref:Amino acid ABC transporter permease n=1 Tax=Nocardioides marmorisolisilvae TaxID=1542737 RepID=A0A3N0DIE1_9ACTN|nr:amino acid ABC transporter permease [Nocardioides marmorisolisilvae]RNL75458.1 amino acid ABC transporter permease [Nocardioides marmorisolisilvae]
MTASTSDWTPSPRELQRQALRRALARRRRLLALVITVVALAVLVLVTITSPGWDRFQQTFLSWHHAKAAFPDVAKGFWTNIKMFVIAEPIILAIGVLVAVTRNSVTPWLTPARLLAVAYTDVFRGLPTLLVVFVACLGIPALNLTGVPTSLTVLGTVALVLCYGAYVAEVIRSGIDSIHPSQIASAEALALSRGQTTRYVVLPQAIRRVGPPLLNDFVSLQKDTSLVASVGVAETLLAASDYGNYNFNYTPLLVSGLFFLALTIPLARLTDWLGHRALVRERGR